MKLIPLASLVELAEKFKTSVASVTSVRVVPSNTKLDSAVAVPSPSDVSILSLPSLPIALIATVTVLNVLSPARNVPPLFVPLVPRRLMSIVPVKLAAGIPPDPVILLPFRSRFPPS